MTKKKNNHHKMFFIYVQGQLEGKILLLKEQLEGRRFLNPAIGQYKVMGPSDSNQNYLEYRNENIKSRFEQFREYLKKTENQEQWERIKNEYCEVNGFDPATITQDKLEDGRFLRLKNKDKNQSEESYDPFIDIDSNIEKWNGFSRKNQEKKYYYAIKYEGDLNKLLKEHIRKEEKEKIAQEVVYKVFPQIVDFNKKNKIPHRDVKLGNILFAKNKTIFKLIDPYSEEVEISTLCGTPRYLSPDRCLNIGEECDLSTCDTWAFGVVTFCILGIDFLEKFDSYTLSIMQKSQLKKDSRETYINNFFCNILDGGFKEVKEQYGQQMVDLIQCFIPPVDRNKLIQRAYTYDKAAENLEEYKKKISATKIQKVWRGGEVRMQTNYPALYQKTYKNNDRDEGRINLYMMTKGIKVGSKQIKWPKPKPKKPSNKIKTVSKEKFRNMVTAGEDVSNINIDFNG